MLGFFQLARLEERQDLSPLEVVDIAELARLTLLDFYLDFSRIGIVPQTNIPERSINVNANVDALRRVFHNLLSNALKYGADGKKIGLCVRVENNMVWVDVWDDGKGIPAENLPHIFERLYVSETSMNAALRGTGLGLTIAKNLIEKQGGHIFAESKPCVKTVFSFCLPLFE